MTRVQVAGLLVLGFAAGLQCARWWWRGSVPRAQVEEVRREAESVLRECREVRARQRDPNPLEFQPCPKELRPDCYHTESEERVLGVER